MAKNKLNTNAFGVNPDEFNESRRRRDSEGSEVGEPKGYKKEVQARERKDKRVQILTYESLINRMDSFAQRKGVSRAEVFEAAVAAYLDEFDV